MVINALFLNLIVQIFLFCFKPVSNSFIMRGIEVAVLLCHLGTKYVHFAQVGVFYAKTLW